MDNPVKVIKYRILQREPGIFVGGEEYLKYARHCEERSNLYVGHADYCTVEYNNVFTVWAFPLIEAGRLYTHTPAGLNHGPVSVSILNAGSYTLYHVIASEARQSRSLQGEHAQLRDCFVVPPRNDKK